MKVVLFCGGFGMRIRADNQSAPKPMTPIGDRPILWHIMKWYATHGHTDFILCLGHGAQAVKDYFLDYRETVSNDFVLSDGGRSVELLAADIADWRITFVDTGLRTAIGERLRRVRPFLDGDEVFLANYGDIVTDAPMNELIAALPVDCVGSLVAVPPENTFHIVRFGEGDRMTGVEAVKDEDFWINGGYFVFRQGIFDYMQPDEDLITGACERAARDGRFVAHRHHGFWASMDTLKERAALEERHASGDAPWEIWRTGAPR